MAAHRAKQPIQGRKARGSGAPRTDLSTEPVDPVGVPLTPRRVMLAVLLAAAIYALLALPPLGLSRAYAPAYRLAMNMLFGSFDGGSVEFTPAPGLASNPNDDSEITVRPGRASLHKGTTAHSARVTGFLPTVEILSLCLATPIALRGRVLLALKGLALIQVFIALRVLVIIIYWFCQPGPWAMYTPRPWFAGVLSSAFEFFAVAPTCTVVVPVVVWAVVAPWRELLLTVPRPGAARA